MYGQNERQPMDFCGNFAPKSASFGAGVWPMPTAFTARNLGQEMQTGVSSADGVATLWCDGQFIEVDSSDSWQPLVERTRQPNDGFAADLQDHFKSAASGPGILSWEGKSLFGKRLVSVTVSTHFPRHDGESVIPHHRSPWEVTAYLKI